MSAGSGVLAAGTAVSFAVLAPLLVMLLAVVALLLVHRGPGAR